MIHNNSIWSYRNKLAYGSIKLCASYWPLLRLGSLDTYGCQSCPWSLDLHGIQASLSSSIASMLGDMYPYGRSVGRVNWGTCLSHPLYMAAPKGVLSYCIKTKDSSFKMQLFLWWQNCAIFSILEMTRMVCIKQLSADEAAISCYCREKQSWTIKRGLD